MKKVYILIWSLCITGLTSLIILFSTIIPIRKINSLPLSDKVYHAGVYALFGFILAGLLRSITDHHLSSIVVEAVSIASLIGIFFEVIQLFIPKRTADVLDICANIIGASIGAIVFYVIYKLLYT